MPINHAIQKKFISDNEFYDLDYEIMGLAFAIHREMGRLWNEKIYQNELAYRCQKNGFENVETEVEIKVTYEDFQKIFYIDLLINGTIVYELKTVSALTGEHHQQTLNYLFLTGLQRGKLINMRPGSVESKFVSTTLTSEKRFDYRIDDHLWQEIDEDSVWLKKIMKNLFQEWGTFLDTSLFYEAILHFRGGEENVVKKVEVMKNSQMLGHQKMHLLNNEIAFKISSLTQHEKYFEEHLRHFLYFTPLKAIQWINMNHNRIEFKTIIT